ncbi:MULTISPECIES: sugar-binding transcriptional regulator [unclassified Salinibacterium]|uniref:sugar-binding transcriptional regulator n=1 Tax=unclassified Salinibacterium TaxID=2632331 RepID=UPI001F0E1BC2|nr:MULTISPECIES: sugar-binding domain-containing protein [unclassified Salinibacterium]
MSDELLMVRAAELYYEDGKTQDEIGALLRTTRWKVGRLLAKARDRGIVRIEIVHPRARRLSLERLLREQYGLADAIVVPAADDADVQASVSRAAADYLAALRPIPRVLGISWGRTLSAVADRLAPGWANEVRVVQINGGISLSSAPRAGAGSAASTAALIAHKAGGQAILLPSPAILEHAATKAAIESDRTVAGVLDLAKTATAFLFSAGVADGSSVLVESGYLSAADVDELVQKGAVGDVVGRFINADGEIVDPALDARTVGVGHQVLREASTSVLVIAGSSKHPVAKAVVSSGLCSVIVTDEETARALTQDSAHGASHGTEQGASHVA